MALSCQFSQPQQPKICQSSPVNRYINKGLCLFTCIKLFSQNTFGYLIILLAFKIVFLSLNCHNEQWTIDNCGCSWIPDRCFAGLTEWIPSKYLCSPQWVQQSGRTSSLYIYQTHDHTLWLVSGQRRQYSLLNRLLLNIYLDQWSINS